MNIYERHAAGIKSVQTYLGSACPVISWAGADYTVITGSVQTSKELDAGGFKMQADLIFVVCSDVLPSVPQLKQTITYNGNAYQIQAVNTLPGGTLIRIECNDPNNDA